MPIPDTTVFLYLAVVYLIDGALLNLLRRYNISDFVIHILAGIILGLLLQLYGIFGEIPTGLTTPTAGVTLVINLGLLLFMMYVGFNFEQNLLRLIERPIFTNTASFFVIVVLVMGSISYFLIFNNNPSVTGGSWLPIVLFVSAFLTLNVGAVLASGFHGYPALRRPLTNLVQIAALLDILVLVVYGGFKLYFSLNLEALSLATSIAYILHAIVLILFTIPVFWARQANRANAFAQAVFGKHHILLKAGLFFIFLYSGFAIGVPVLVLGAWAGLVARSLSADAEFDLRHKVFPRTSFLIVLPFVEVGRFLATVDFYSVELLLKCAYVLLALVFISSLFGLISIRRRDYTLVMALGAFPRGELTVLILWLSTEFKVGEDLLLGAPVIALSIVAVLLTTILVNIFCDTILKRI